MNTINGSLDVRIEGDNVYLRVADSDIPVRATSELSTENVKTLRAMLEEALIGVECGPEYATHTRLNQ
jgi:hypothetical protein